MPRPLLTALLAATTLAAPVAAPLAAQSPAAQQRWDQAQARYQREFDLYMQERDRYMASRGGSGRGGYDRGAYDRGPRDDGYYEDNFATDYDAARDYRDGPNYRERTLSSDDQVYRGSDGRYYCKRGDGTTGLIIGGAAGGVLGNVIDGGRRRTAGTLIGGALGALLGRSVQQNQDQVRCR